MIWRSKIVPATQGVLRSYPTNQTQTRRAVVVPCDTPSAVCKKTPTPNCFFWLVRNLFPARGETKSPSAPPYILRSAPRHRRRFKQPSCIASTCPPELQGSLPTKICLLPQSNHTKYSKVKRDSCSDTKKFSLVW